MLAFTIPLMPSVCTDSDSFYWSKKRDPADSGEQGEPGKGVHAPWLAMWEADCEGLGIKGMFHIHL